MNEDQMRRKNTAINYLWKKNLLPLVKFVKMEGLVFPGSVYVEFYKKEGKSFEDAKRDLKVLSEIGLVDEREGPVGRCAGQEPDIIQAYVWDDSLNWVFNPPYETQ